MQVPQARKRRTGRWVLLILSVVMTTSVLGARHPPPHVIEYDFQRIAHERTDPPAIQGSNTRASFGALPSVIFLRHRAISLTTPSSVDAMAVHSRLRPPT